MSKAQIVKLTIAVIVTLVAFVALMVSLLWR